MSLKVLLVGDDGRMGGAIRALCASDGAFDAQVSAGLNTQRIELNADIAYNCVIDFSTPEATERSVQLARKNNCPLILGTTGHDVALRQKLIEQMRELTVVWDGNFSIGIAVLASALKYCLRYLDTDFQAEIIEMHHARKVDAPSGTALKLLKIIQNQRPDNKIINGRCGKTGIRGNQEIGVHAIRAGDIVGNHKVILAGKGEYLELGHVACDRSLFAKGALMAAKWAQTQQNGLYTMADVLGIPTL